MFNPRNWRVRVKWVGFGPMGTAPGTQGNSISPSARVLGIFRTRRMAGALGILVLLLGIFALTRLAHSNPIAHTSEVTTMGPVALVIEQVNVGGEPIWVAHSPLDIGQLPDIFDDNTDTLIRGQSANPFILNFEFSRPQAIRGFSMDFGRMDFAVRVQVSGPDSSTPIFYQGEYHQQPDIPHIDIAFTRGPQQVKSIHIEIEQLDPPAEVHIHVREIVFKK